MHDAAISKVDYLCENVKVWSSTTDYEQILLGLDQPYKTDQEKLQITGIKALLDITGTQDLDRNMHILKRIMELQGGVLFNNALFTYPDSLNLHIVCLQITERMFRNIVDPPYEYDMYEQGVNLVWGITNTMKKFPHDFLVQFHGVSCLNVLTRSNITSVDVKNKFEKECRRQVVGCHGVQILDLVLKETFKQDRDMCACTKNLRNEKISMLHASIYPLLQVCVEFDKNTNACKYTTGSTFIYNIVANLEKTLDTGSYNITQLTINILVTLSGIQSSVKKMIDAGLQNQCVRLGQLCFDKNVNLPSEQMLWQVCTLLKHMGYVSTLQPLPPGYSQIQTIPSFWKKAEWNLLVTVIYHTNTPETRFLACMALYYVALTDSEENRYLLNSGALDALMQMIQKHPTDYKSTRCGCSILTILAQQHACNQQMKTTGFREYIVQRVEYESTMIDNGMEHLYPTTNDLLQVYTSIQHGM